MLHVILFHLINPLKITLLTNFSTLYMIDKLKISIFAILFGASSPVSLYILWHRLSVSCIAVWLNIKGINALNLEVKTRGTHNVNESGEKNQDDCKNSHQGAVESGLNNPFRQSLQRHREKLSTEEKQHDLSFLLKVTPQYLKTICRHMMKTNFFSFFFF